MVRVKLLQLSREVPGNAFETNLTPAGLAIQDDDTTPNSQTLSYLNNTKIQFP